MEYHQLTQVERYAIARMCARRFSVREIGRCLGHSPATISRELKRNRCMHDGFYRAQKAHSRASDQTQCHAQRRASTAKKNGL